MDNLDFRNELKRFFRSGTNFIIAEAVLIFLTVVLFSYELGYWVFTVLFAVLSALFYIGINLDYWRGKKLDEDEVFVYNHLQKMADDARNSMQSIKEMGDELDKIKKSIGERRNIQ